MNNDDAYSLIFATYATDRKSYTEFRKSIITLAQKKYSLNIYIATKCSNFATLNLNVLVLKLHKYL